MTLSRLSTIIYLLFVIFGLVLSLVDCFHVKRGDGVLFYLMIVVVEVIGIKFILTNMLAYSKSLTQDTDPSEHLLTIHEYDDDYYGEEDDDEH
jgi:hypothetical protein